MTAIMLVRSVTKMSEYAIMKYCEICGHETSHLFSGNGKKGICEDCENPLPQDVSMFVAG